MTPLRDDWSPRRRTPSLEEARRILYKNRIEKLPLVDADGQAGRPDHRCGHREAHHLHQCRQGSATGSCAAARRSAWGRIASSAAQALIEAGADALFIDAATGHTTRVMEVIGKLRELSDRAGGGGQRGDRAGCAGSGRGRGQRGQGGRGSGIDLHHPGDRRGGHAAVHRDPERGGLSAASTA